MFHHHVVQSVRSLRRRPGYVLAIVLTLGIGIGAAGAVISIANGLLLSRLPYAQPDRLVLLTLDNPDEGLAHGAASYPEIRDWRDQGRVFSGIAAFGAGQSLNLTGGERPIRVAATFVSADYFELLGVSPAVGRSFRAEENSAPGAHPVAILSDALWRSSFGGDPGIIGSAVRLNQQPYTVVGVAPAGFQDLALAFGVSGATDVWIPAAMIPTAVHPFYYESRLGRWMVGVARLRPGVELAESRAAMAQVAERLASVYPDVHAGFGIDVSPVSDHFFGFGRLRRFVTALGLGAAFVLLIGCANVANLSLIRAAERRRELAVRQAVGASRGHLIGQVLTESALLALAGGALGLGLSVAATRLMLATSPIPLPSFVEIGTDLRVLIAATAITLASGLAVGIAPALRAGRGALQPSQGARSGRAPELLVVVEVTAAAALLVSAGLMLRSLAELRDADHGFRTGHLLTMRLNLPREGYEERGPRRALFRELKQRLSALPGVSGVGLWGPALPGSNDGYVELVPERRAEADEHTLSYEHRVTPGAVRRLGISLRRGRYLEERDREEALPVALVSESLARTLWPAEDPVGKRFRRGFGDDEPWIEVVGLVSDALQRGRQRQALGAHDVYLPIYQVTTRFVGVLLWGDRAPESLAGEVRRVVASLDPELPVFDIATMEQRVAEEERSPRFYTSLMVAFGAVALALASVGVYGALAYWARLRRRDFGIRLAVGARPTDLVVLVARRSSSLVIAGMGLGLGAGLATSRLLASVLYGVSATDPVVYGAAIAIVLMAGCAATLLPAVRSARVDPAVVLRSD